MTDKRNQNQENMVKDEVLKDVNGGLLITPETKALSDDALDQVTGGARWNWDESDGKRR